MKEHWMKTKFRHLELPVISMQESNGFTGKFDGYVLFSHDGEDWYISFETAVYIDSKTDMIEAAELYGKEEPCLQ